MKDSFYKKVTLPLNFRFKNFNYRYKDSHMAIWHLAEFFERASSELCAQESFFVFFAGMLDMKDSKQEELSDFLSRSDIEMLDKIIERGSVQMIAVKDPENVDYLVGKLKAWSGVEVYKKEDIPEVLHYRNHRLILDILLFSKGTTSIQGISRILAPLFPDLYIPPLTACKYISHLLCGMKIAIQWLN